MNILHITPSILSKTGGPVTTMGNIVKLWQAAGHSVQILTIERAGMSPIGNVPIRQEPASFPVRLSNSNAAVRWLSETSSQFDLAFVHGIWTALNIRAARLLLQLRRRYVMIPHGSLDPFDLRKKAFAKRLIGPCLIRPCLEGSAAVLCSSSREADCLVTYGAKCNVIDLPWPVPPVSSSIERKDARAKLGLANDEFVVLSFGRVDYKKGFPVLLPAIQRLVQVHPNTRLLIVGPDSNGYLAVVQQMVERLGLSKVVTFLPTVTGEDKFRVLRAADCFALPSLNENFGNTVVEAMQMGLPCVISNNVYICDAVDRGGAGFVCPYDEQAVFAGLRQLAENPKLKIQMSAAAIETAKIYEPDRLKSQYLAMLDGLVNARKVN